MRSKFKLKQKCIFRGLSNYNLESVIQIFKSHILYLEDLKMSNMEFKASKNTRYNDFRAIFYFVRNLCIQHANTSPSSSRGVLYYIAPGHVTFAQLDFALHTKQNTH